MWDIHTEWVEILKAFDLAYIYYTERAPNMEYLEIMDTYYTRDMDINWLGSEVWEDDPIPEGIDEAWDTQKITFSPHPSVEEQWGIVVSVYFPIVKDGQTIGILGVDYDITYVNALRNRILIFLIISFAISVLITGLLAFFSSRSVFISIEEREQIAREANERRKEIENLMSALQNTSASRTAFLSSISTQMENPISTIIRLSSLISVDKELSENLRKNVDLINDSGVMLYEVIEDIVDILKIEAGKLKIHPVKYKLPNLISDITAQHSMLAEGRPIKYKLILGEDLPLKLIGDEHRIRHICNHLLSNSFKFTSEGTISVNVTCKWKNGFVWLIIKIRDTGIGMAEEELKNLFVGYGQIDAADKFYKGGTGLGLSISKQIVELMKGTLTAASEKNKGSVFTLCIPQKLLSEEKIAKQTAQELINFQYSKS
jgi:signal transduction histidine kinase